MRSGRISVALAAGVVVMLAAAPAATALDTQCTNSLSNVQITGNVVVPPQATCTITAAHITGNVTVRAGSTLTTFGSTVDGSVLSGGASKVSINGSGVGSTVGGNIALVGTTGTAAVAEVTLPNGNIAVAGGTAGLRGTVSLFRNHVDNGNIVVALNATGIGIFLDENVVFRRNPGDATRGNIDVRGNKVGSNPNPTESLRLTFNNSAGRTAVVGNVVSGKVKCSGNSLPFVGGPNTFATPDLGDPPQCF